MLKAKEMFSKWSEDSARIAFSPDEQHKTCQAFGGKFKTMKNHRLSTDWQLVFRQTVIDPPDFITKDAYVTLSELQLFHLPNCCNWSNYAFCGLNFVFSLFCLKVMTNTLSPNEKDLKKLTDLKKATKLLEIEIGGPDKEDDHPDILEIRRRCIDMVKEFEQDGMFDWPPAKVHTWPNILLFLRSMNYSMLLRHFLRH